MDKQVEFWRIFFLIIIKSHFRPSSRCSQNLPFIIHANWENSSPPLRMDWLTKFQKLLFLSSLQSLNTSLASLSSPALQADPRPTSLSLHQTLHQKASRSTGTISCILGVTSFISHLIFQESQEERGSLHTTSRSALTQANFQSCWREITMKGPIRMSESISWREKFAGDSRKKEVTWALNKKICRYFQYFTECPYSSPVCS